MDEVDPEELPEGGILDRDVTPGMQAVADQNARAVDDALDAAVADYRDHFGRHEEDSTRCNPACASVQMVRWLTYAQEHPSSATMLLQTAIRRLAGETRG